MKNAISILTLLLLNLGLSAQTPSWAWAKSTGTINSQAVTTDKNGNIYISGSFANTTISFDNICESRVENRLFYAFLPHSGYIFVENVFPMPRFRAFSAKTQRWDWRFMLFSTNIKLLRSEEKLQNTHNQHIKT